MVKTKKEIANEYGISPSTLRRWLKKEGICQSKKLLTPKEVKHIYKLFGRPKKNNQNKRNK